METTLTKATHQVTCDCSRNVVFSGTKRACTQYIMENGIRFYSIAPIANPTSGQNESDTENRPESNIPGVIVLLIAFYWIIARGVSSWFDLDFIELCRSPKYFFIYAACAMFIWNIVMLVKQPQNKK
jgi:hypothetical protein